MRKFKPATKYATTAVLALLLMSTAVPFSTMNINAGSAMAAMKNSITLGMSLEPEHLDPTAGAAAAIDEIVYANVFEGLTRINRNGAVKPALAQSWTVSEDGTIYIFHLRSGSLTSMTVPNLPLRM